MGAFSTPPPFSPSLPTRSLNEVLEFAEDTAIDVPKIWDYLGEILAPIVSQSTLSLSFLGSTFPSLVRTLKKREEFDTSVDNTYFWSWSVKK